MRYHKFVFNFFLLASTAIFTALIFIYYLETKDESKRTGRQVSYIFLSLMYKDISRLIGRPVNQHAGFDHGAREVDPYSIRPMPEPLLSNHALACPKALCDPHKPDVEVQEYPVSAAELEKRVIHLPNLPGALAPLDNSRPCHYLKATTGGHAGYDHSATYPYVIFVCQFPPFYVEDSFAIYFVSLGPSRSTMVIHGRRALSFFPDFGGNRARIEGWLKALEAKFGWE